jgi:phenylalanyl-tRNA synthetase beta chain
VEEILRIDGLDNIDIPDAITLTPAVEENYKEERLKEKLANVLTGLGFTEILTNSITNSAYFSEAESSNMVKLLNNLSNELNALRPTMLPTALEVISFNLNRKNNSLRLFEFGKTYATNGVGAYSEQQHLCLYLTGQVSDQNWKGKAVNADLFYIKGVAAALLQNIGLPATFEENEGTLIARAGKKELVRINKTATTMASKFDIKQPVYVADFDWSALTQMARTKIQYKEVSKFPAVQRDLSMIVSKQTAYGQIEEGVKKLRLKQLKEVKLFDVFQSEKLGADKKSLAVNFTFQDEEKTLTDKEIDNWMNKIMNTLEKDLQAEIRKA